MRKQAFIQLSVLIYVHVLRLINKDFPTLVFPR